MLTVQYKGKGERTIGTQVVYPGELLHPTPNLLAAWQAEYGDIFVLVGSAEAQPGNDGTVVVQDSGTGAEQAQPAQVTEATPKARRK